jgi:Tfp pilus assembly protein PilZ
MTDNPADRRKYVRYNLELMTHLEVEAKDGRVKEYQMATANICAGGIFFQTKRRIAEGTQLKAEIFLPVESPDMASGCFYAGILIMVSGSVLAQRPDGIAVQFNEDYGIAGRLKRIATEQEMVLH